MALFQVYRERSSSGCAHAWSGKGSTEAFVQNTSLSAPEADHDTTEPGAEAYIQLHIAIMTEDIAEGSKVKNKYKIKNHIRLENRC